MESDVRVVIPVRMRKSAVDQLDKIVEEEDSNRSEILRRLFKLGLVAWTKGAR